MDTKIIEQLDRIEEKLDRLLDQAIEITSTDLFGSDIGTISIADSYAPIVETFIGDEWPEYEGDLTIDTIDINLGSDQ